MATANHPHDEDWIGPGLDALRAAHAFRAPRLAAAPGGRVRDPSGRELLNFCGNDYLALSRHPRVIARARAALEQDGAGATSARLVCGNHPIHAELERRLAAAKGYDACLLFGSGYLANLGALTALCGRHDRIFADRVAHACLLDGARLSGAELIRFRHNDAGHLEELLARHAGQPGRSLIVTESVFSMDGDVAPLAEIADLALRHGGLLLVDEAHATGTHGPGGAGLVAGLGLQPAVNLCMGTLSKALGSYGGFICCSTALRGHLVNHARTFLFATALPPSVVAAGLGALEVLADEPDRPVRLQNLATRLREALRADGWDTCGSTTQIVPILAGSNEEALRLAAGLEAAGIGAVAIRPPTVPVGAARVRLTVNLDHTEANLDTVVAALRGLRA